MVTGRLTPPARRLVRRSLERAAEDAAVGDDGVAGDVGAGVGGEHEDGPTMSVGWPQRCNAVRSEKFFFCSGVSRLMGRSVAIGPGARQLTVMLWGPSSRAWARAMPMRAAFVAE